MLNAISVSRRVHTLLDVVYAVARLASPYLLWRAKRTRAAWVLGVCWRFVWAGTCSAAATRYRFGHSHRLQYAPGMTTTWRLYGCVSCRKLKSH